MATTNGSAGPRPARAPASVREGSHSLDERASEAQERLSPAQVRVVEFLQRRRDDVAFLSTADIAAQLGVSDATVIRTTQSLGYAGLAELKAQLRVRLRERMAPAQRYARSIQFLTDDSAGILDHLVADQIDILGEARRTLRAEDFRQAVALIAGAERVVCFGGGPQVSLADYVVLTLRRFGRHGLALGGWGVTLADSLMELGPGDVLLLIAYERTTPDIETVLNVARRRKVAVVLVTDTLALTLKGRYSVALVARRGSPEAATTITVPLVVVEALLLGVAARDRERTLGALEEARQLREDVSGQ